VTVALALPIDGAGTAHSPRLAGLSGSAQAARQLLSTPPPRTARPSPATWPSLESSGTASATPPTRPPLRESGLAALRKAAGAKDLGAAPPPSPPCGTHSTRV
jgi:hypothetical protein